MKPHADYSSWPTERLIARAAALHARCVRMDERGHPHPLSDKVIEAIEEEIAKRRPPVVYTVWVTTRVEVYRGPDPWSVVPRLIGPDVTVEVVREDPPDALD